jgi:hypothetical protein
LEYGYLELVSDTTIGQVPKFDYLGVEISAKRDLKQEVRMQATKAARISGCLYNLIWVNKYMSTEYKVRNYKTNVCTVLAYASEKEQKQLIPNNFSELPR